MFTDIKNEINNPAVRRIFAACVFDSSPEGVDKKIAEYNQNDNRQLYGWVEDEKILGVCGFEKHPDSVKILHIAVCASARMRGIGHSMITALQQLYDTATIEAETDDDAVEFYKKCGFEVTAFCKYDVRRWQCVLVKITP